MPKDIKELAREIATLSASEQELLTGILVCRMHRSRNLDPLSAKSVEQGTDAGTLTSDLRTLTETLSSSKHREAVERAALGLNVLAALGLWPILERWWSEREHELTENEKEHLRSLGLDPDA
jgi:hypothetical protein